MEKADCVFIAYNEKTIEFGDVNRDKFLYKIESFKRVCISAANDMGDSKYMPRSAKMGISYKLAPTVGAKLRLLHKNSDTGMFFPDCTSIKAIANHITGWAHKNHELINYSQLREFLKLYFEKEYRFLCDYEVKMTAIGQNFSTYSNLCLPVYINGELWSGGDCRTTIALAKAAYSGCKKHRFMGEVTINVPTGTVIKKP